MTALDENTRLLDSARRWAVFHEQNAVEYARRVRLASALIQGEPCNCDTDRQCLPCHLGAILDGDE